DRLLDREDNRHTADPSLQSRLHIARNDNHTVHSIQCWMDRHCPTGYWWIRCDTLRSRQHSRKHEHIYTSTSQHSRMRSTSRKRNSISKRRIRLLTATGKANLPSFSFDFS